MTTHDRIDGDDITELLLAGDGPHPLPDGAADRLWTSLEDTLDQPRSMAADQGVIPLHVPDDPPRRQRQLRWVLAGTAAAAAIAVGVVALLPETAPQPSVEVVSGDLSPDQLATAEGDELCRAIDTTAVSITLSDEAVWSSSTIEEARWLEAALLELAERQPSDTVAAELRQHAAVAALFLNALGAGELDVASSARDRLEQRLSPTLPTSDHYICSNSALEQSP